jgi:hypothetical protein
MALPQPTGSLRRIVLESFLIAGWQMIRPVINESYTLYGARRFVIEMSSAVNDNFSCYEKLDYLHFGPLFSGDDAGFVQ